MRYTPKQLREDIENLNSRLADEGSRIRFESGGRNGYQTVDQYSVDENGERIGTGVDRMICGGSSRECYDEARVVFYQELNRIARS